MRLRMHEIAQTRIRYGYRRVHIMLKCEGSSGGRNLVYRLYREKDLGLRRRRPRRRNTAVNRAARHRAQGLNDAWSLNFVHDHLSNGQAFRVTYDGVHRAERQAGFLTPRHNYTLRSRRFADRLLHAKGLIGDPRAMPSPSS
jgi:putative transposase